MDEPSSGDQSDEGRRIAEKAGQEAEGILGARLGRIADHFTAAEADRSDKAELWGRRIGRALSLIGVLVLGYMLYRQVTLR